MGIIKLRAFALIFTMLHALLQLQLGQSSEFVVQCDAQYHEIIADIFREKEAE